MKPLRLVLAAVLVLSCALPPPVTDPEPGPGPAPVPPPEAGDCSAGCARLKELGCKEGEGSTPSDPDSCRKDCEYVETQGMVRINASCWRTISACSELDARCSVDQ